MIQKTITEVFVLQDDIKSLKGIKNFAILGGTFDPIHFGHISVAEAVLNQTNVEKVLLIPSGKPPHKEHEDVSDGCTRLEMARLAVEGHKNMLVSSIEIDRGGMTYTVDTVAQLKELLGDEVEFKFIMGADAIHYITTWKDYKHLLHLCSFIAVTRPGYNKNAMAKEIEKMEEHFKCDIEFIEIPPVDVSSSQIRENIGNGISINGMVPDKVEDYILKKGLYK
ncbi:MAG: nicotinate-nucleotide adenylyltransferase [Lachnospiraceae bacterium]|nr:nicotinate-nucleotide adenylyltransferase [Lachnospiraceae bacterium]